MKNKKTVATHIAVCVGSFAAGLFLLNSAYAGKDCGATHSSKAPTVVGAAQEPAQHVDEHAGHNHAPVTVPAKQVDEHAGHNHAPVTVPVKQVDEHAGHNHAPNEAHTK